MFCRGNLSNWSKRYKFRAVFSFSSHSFFSFQLLSACGTHKYCVAIHFVLLNVNALHSRSRKTFAAAYQRRRKKLSEYRMVCHFCFSRLSVSSVLLCVSVFFILLFLLLLLVLFVSSIDSVISVVAFDLAQSDFTSLTKYWFSRRIFFYCM